jgi:MFS transporter, NNP family, nitrate/nitrite transporter
MEVSAPALAPAPRTRSAGWSDRQLEVGPTATTIALVGGAKTRWRAADVAACLAELAVTDELIVVYGSDERETGPGVHAVLALLRDRLPRHSVVAVYVSPRIRSLERDIVLLDDLLEVGGLPIVVTPVDTLADVAAELRDHVGADRVLTMSYVVTYGADEPQMWQPVPTAGPTCVRRAA